MSAHRAAAIALGRPAAGRRLAVVVGHALAFALALAAWIAAVEHADLARIDGYGLLPALPAAFYVALVALTAGFLVAVAQRTSSVLLGAYVIALVVALHATAPLVYSEPHYAWTYKHLGVAEYIAHFGTTDRSIDIYHNWPGFFALVALLQRASGASLISIAPWAELFFEAAYVAATVFLLRGVTRDRRVVWSAAWLFVLADWFAQGYFAPQSFAYLLSLVLIALCVRCAPAPRGDSPRRGPWVDDADSAPLRPTPALLLGGVLYVAILTSHQLSPLLCIVAVGAFALTTRRISWRPVAAMLVLEVGWVAAAWPLLSSKYHLFDFSPLERPAAAPGNPMWALPGMGASTFAARASVAVVCVLALAALWRRRRSGRFDLPLLALIVAPVLVVAIQPYNGEGVFRAYLFALPWLCYLAAELLVGDTPVGEMPVGEMPVGETPVGEMARGTHRAAHPRTRGTLVLALRIAPLAGVTAALGAAFLFASYGRELVNRITPQDVAIERFYESHAPPGSAVVYLAPNVPNRLTYRYADKQVWAASFSPSLTEDPVFRGHALGFSDLPALEDKLRSLQATQAYVMIGPSQVNFVDAFGLLPAGSVEGLVEALRASTDFQLVAQDRDAYLFRLTTPTGIWP